MKKMLRKVLYITPFIFLTGCGFQGDKYGDFAPSSPNEYSNVYQWSKKNEVFKDDLTYNQFKEKNDSKEDTVIIFYDNKGCLCFYDVLDAARDYFYDNNLYVAIMSVHDLDGQNTYGYSTSNKTFPSITTYIDGKITSATHYRESNKVFSDSTEFSNYMNTVITFK